MKSSQIAAQLYTCREILKSPAEIAATLKRLRAAGYRSVQVSGLGDISDDELVRILEGEGLHCCATHEPSKVILDEPERVVQRLQQLGCRYTAYPYPAGIDMGCPASVQNLIGKLDHAGAILAEAGLTLCYHNHHHEFQQLDGRLILDLIYSGTRPRHLQGEIDTYWVQFGGGNPAQWCQKLAGRLPLLHLKDYMVGADNHVTMSEIGAGNLDWNVIIPSAEASGCQWFIVEQDTCPGDPVASLARSYRWLQENFCED
jgi:sugar phosphate isomerase/epimerase